MTNVFSARALEEAGGGGFSIKTLPKARYVRRLWETSMAAAAIVVTCIAAVMRGTSRTTAYGILLLAGVFAETVRRGWLAISVRQIRGPNDNTESTAYRREVLVELRAAGPFAAVMTAWFFWIASAEILLGTGALAAPFGDLVGTLFGLVHVSLAVTTIWPTVSTATANVLANELAWPLLLASLLLVPTTGSVIYGGDGGAFLAVVRTAAAFGGLFALRVRDDTEQRHNVAPLSVHAQQLQSVRLAVQTAWVWTVSAPWLFVMIAIVLLSEYAGRLHVSLPPPPPPQQQPTPQAQYLPSSQPQHPARGKKGHDQATDIFTIIDLAKAEQKKRSRAQKDTYLQDNSFSIDDANDAAAESENAQRKGPETDNP